MESCCVLIGKNCLGMLLVFAPCLLTSKPQKPPFKGFYFAFSMGLVTVIFASSVYFVDAMYKSRVCSMILV